MIIYRESKHFLTNTWTKTYTITECLLCLQTLRRSAVTDSVWHPLVTMIPQNRSQETTGITKLGNAY